MVKMKRKERVFNLFYLLNENSLNYPFSTHYWETKVILDLMGIFGYGLAMIE